MLINWTFGRKLAIGFAIATFVIVLVGIAGHRSTTNLIENNGWVEHSYRVRTNVELLLSLLKDAETGQRGYTITGNQSFLDPYNTALPMIDRTFEAVRTLSADNPRQQRRLDELRPQIDAKVKELAKIIDARSKQGAEAAAALVSSGVGKGYMDAIRRYLGEIEKEEQALLAERRRDADASAANALRMILWGSIFGTVLIVLAGTIISRSLTQQVGAAVHHIQASSTELQTAANQQATGAKQQATAMNEISTTISELMATSRQIAESARRVSEIADQTARASRSGELTVNKGHEALGSIRRQVDLIVNHMLELGKKSQQIGAVLDIVSELAEQTNILAINATIEAAGAGESGRRFGVVADEIRKLADRVGGSTKEIRNLIDDVRSAVNTSIMTTETGSKATDAGADQFALVASAFNQIGSQVATTTEAAKEIELSTKQQASAVEQVNVAITNVAQASRESEVSTSQTLRTAAELSHLSRELLRIIQPQVDRTARPSIA